MKRFFLIILFVILGSNCFAALKWLESIEVENHTQQDIFIEYELKQGQSLEEKNYFFDFTIDHKLFRFSDNLFNRRNTIHSYKCWRIIEYNYINIEGKREYNPQIPDAIPFLEKLRSIYSKLEITNNEGNILFSLDDAENTLVKKYIFGNVNVYSLVICDDDHYEKGIISEEEKKAEVENASEFIVGIKKASEW